MWLQYLFLVVALVSTYKASKYLGDCTDELARITAVNTLIRGLIIDAAASSFPEFATVIQGLIKGSFEIGLGTIAGSAIFNIMVIPAICAIAVKGLKVEKKIIFRDGLFYFLVVIIFIIITSFGIIPDNPNYRFISALSGGIGVIVYIIYIIIMLLIFGGDKKNSAKKLRIRDWAIYGFKIVLSLFFIWLSTALVVSSSLKIAANWGVSEALFGLLFLATSTSLPDLFISLNAAKRGDLNGAVANAFGSNVFDILICLGLPILWRGGVEIKWSQSRPILISLIIINVVIGYLMRDGKLSVKEGWTLVVLFLGWCIIMTI